MAVKPFFEDSGSSHFDPHGRPLRPGIYEFRRTDGMKLLYTLDWMEREEGEEPRLRVVHCNRISEFPSPAHALKNLDGSWVRWLGPREAGALPGDASPEAGDGGTPKEGPDPS
ncbi:MAG: hypothetical protein JF616_15430 [Fibrobacteres bacterium]|jgi:hypothetical protein|nr:hypothetical protein [Fibrobacterota bacterium]